VLGNPQAVNQVGGERLEQAAAIATWDLGEERGNV